MKIVKYKKYWPYLVALLISLPMVFLLKENMEKVIILITSLIIWAIFSVRTRNAILISFLYTIFVLPFNITLLIPTTVNIFNTTILNISPYVDGIYSNYLVPTISILDLALVLLLLSFFIEKGVKHLYCWLKEYVYLLTILILFLFLQNIFLLNPLTIFGSLRIFMYILTFSIITNWIKCEWQNKYFKSLLILLLLNLLIQGTLGIFQFTRGSSLGLSFLGESLVANGMQGSSFVTLDEGIYLRAYGTFPHPNVFGGYLVLSFVLAWISSIKLKRKWKYLAYSIMLLSFVVSVFTFSRICIVILVFGMFLVLISKMRKDRFFTIATPLIFQRFQNLFVSGDTSWEDRKNLLEVGKDILKENWLLGTGVGNFVKHMEGRIPRTGNGVLLLQPVHNMFVLAFSEFGIFGVLIIFSILLKYLISTVNWKENIYVKVFVVISILVIGSFDHYLLSLPQGMAISLFLISSLVL